MSSQPAGQQWDDIESRRGMGPAVPIAAYAFAVAMSGTTLPTPLYTLYQAQYGFSSLIVTVIFAAYAVGVIATLFLCGQLSDTIGRRPVLVAGLVLAAASALCFLFEGGLPALFAGRVLSGLSAGLFTGSATVAIVELAPERLRGRATLVATVANMGGLGVGPLLAGLLSEYAPAPLGLVFVVNLALVAVAIVGILRIPETVRVQHGAPMRPGRLRVPRSILPTFVPAALAGFAGFAMFGLFTAVTPTYIDEVEGIGNRAVQGAVVFSVFMASTLGQLTMTKVGVRRALPWGTVLLGVGMVLIFCSLLLPSLALLVLGGVISGSGQGLSFRAAVTAVGRRSPPDQRAEVTSALFVACYVGISIPVVGIGALGVATGLRTAGLVFTVCVALLAAATAAWLVRNPAGDEERRPPSD
ncbi:MFS transporter [Actinopolymorpha pittospori]|uniref:MFS family permease n=1 Tax=Actinopolymorpha pittospori TaxID=648752 RepID=A0A927MZ71_9ACTN|nr:MFS transporter [Actinopolymorpha pittospori]MBE1609264.1 MFS family permease [Actinopolymorpha pittospori]